MPKRQNSARSYRRSLSHANRSRAARRRVYPFLFFGRPQRKRDHAIWQVRDLICLPHLLQALQRQDEELGEIILNMPPQNGEGVGRLAPVAVRLGLTDTLLVVTRFPLDDDPTDKRALLRGYTTLEPEVFEAARRVFKYLNRKKMVLQPGLWEFMRKGFEDRVSIEYFQQLGARFRKLRTAEIGRAAAPPAAATTSAFLLNAQLRNGGPRLIACFAMDHISTLAWSQIVALQHPDWLTRPGFTMVDLVRKEVPKRPLLLTFTREWRPEIVLQVRPKPGESEEAFWAKISMRPAPSSRFGVRQRPS